MAKRDREMNKEEEEEEPWGTLEELLLACAVNRHGSKSWDSIATELQSRTSHHHLRPFFTPPNCRRRFAHLRRRFSHPDSDDTSLKDMVDELRRLRVAELRRDVERHDVSIEFLQLKVKRLEQEHQQSFNPKDEVKDETDLPERREPETNHPPEVVGRSVYGDDNRSFNESNSTSTQKREEGDKPELKHEPGILEEKTVRAVIEPVRAGPKEAELCDSVAESKREEGTKHNNNKNNNNNNNTSSEVQSPRNKKRRRSGEEDEEPEAGKLAAVKSQPLIKLLAILRSHKNGSLFERRLRSQETEKYKKMIRQHMDLQTVQTRLDKGFYLHSHHRFFRDLLLLLNNATVFFPNNSPEHIAARQLTKLVTKQIPRKQLPEPFHTKPETMPPSPPPLVVCRRRSAPNKTRDADEAKLKQQPNRSLSTGGNKVLLEEKCIKKNKKREVMKEMHELSRRSSRSNSNKVTRDINNHSEDDDDDDDNDDKLESRVKRKESMMKKKKADTDTIDEDDYVEKEKEKKGRRDSRREKWRKDETRENEERGENSRGRRPGRPPKRQPVGRECRRDVGRGKRGREGGASEMEIAEDSGRSRKRLRR